jgi:hypothetical protein
VAPDVPVPEPTGEPEVPTPAVIDASEEMFVAMFETESYREPPWVAETEEPRAASHSVSPHGDVRVYANDILIASIASGKGVTTGDGGELVADTDVAHDPGAMSVKEFYQDGALVGRAALLKLEGTGSSVTYYCDGPAELCGVTDSPPTYGTGIAVSCGFCHGGLVYTVNYPGE